MNFLKAGTLSYAMCVMVITQWSMTSAATAIINGGDAIKGRAIAAPIILSTTSMVKMHSNTFKGASRL